MMVVLSIIIFFANYDGDIDSYNTTILAHEYLIDEYRLGDVIIEDEVMIGANSTILPGVVIGKRAVVAAGSVVHKDIPEGCFAGGNPVQIIYTKEQMEERKKNDPFFQE